MVSVNFFGLLFFLPGGLVQPLGNTPNLQPEDPERDAITRRFNFFDLELLKEFSESSGNVFISPASIKTTLALILEGAKGRSAEEIGSALRIDDINRRDIRQLLQRLLFDLNDRRANTALESGNALFVSDKYKLVPEYANKVNRHYKALTQSLNFSNPEQSAGTINFWVRNTTHGLIDQIVDAQNLQGNTQIILTNALFFKGKWKTAFDPSNTRNKCFRSPTRNCVNVPMMELTANLSYAFNVDLNSHVVELPYLDDKYAMLLLVPNSDNNVRTLARDMQHSQLNHILDGLRLTELIVELPRFEIEYSEDLVNVLANMNVREIFGDNANLTGIIAKDNIKVSKLIHKTKVEVNEQGTKAAAVTGAVVVPLMGVTTQRVVADRPFIFFIYHRESSNIIFEGMLAEPKAVENSIKSRSSFPQRSDTTRYGARRYIIDDYVQF